MGILFAINSIAITVAMPLRRIASAKTHLRKMFLMATMTTLASLEALMTLAMTFPGEMMIDQAHINLLTLMPVPLKKVGGTNGGEYHGPCPFCGGKDRFIVQPNNGNGGHWWCRQCDQHGDAVAFVMAHYQLDFKAACEFLNVSVPDLPTQPRSRYVEPPVNAGDLKDYACFEAGWQEAAFAFVHACSQRLIQNWNGRAGAYLEARGISQRTARANHLGLSLERLDTYWGHTAVHLPRGITIPWLIDHQMWNVRVRRPNPDVEAGADKYMSATGCANGMYRINDVLPGDHVLMTEGEFDAMLLRHCLLMRHAVDTSVVSIGSCSGARVLRWVTHLALAERVYLAFDNDEAGEKAANYWLAALPRKARRLKPTKKDITEMWQAGELAQFMDEVG